MASNGSWFMVTWTIFKFYLLEVGLTQNWETMALRTVTIIVLFYFTMCGGPAWIDIHWYSIWLRARSHMSSHYAWGFVTTIHDFGSVLGWPLDTLFWALTISCSRLLACVWSGPTLRMAHILVLATKVRRNERLWQTLDIGNMFGPTFGLKKFTIFSV